MVKQNKPYKRVEAIFLVLTTLTLIPITLQAMQRKCYSNDKVIKVRHNSCLLRPDTGPCRADIIQWYYDAKQSKCYQFFWGGCQGNGNRFETKMACIKYCNLPSNSIRKPYYCDLPFDYGTCFGHYTRWYWNRYSRICKRALYSGCGGNQNNFQSMQMCEQTCFLPPNNSLSNAGSSISATSCIPQSVYEVVKG